MTNEKANHMLRSFIQECFHQNLDEVHLVICGNEMRTCGGILDWIDPNIPVTLIDFNLRRVGRIYDGHECHMPEMCIPFSENTVVLVSILYAYQYEDAVKKLVALGIPEDHIAWGRPLAQEMLIEYSDYFAAARMDQKVKQLFDHIGKDISSIRYMDIGANNFCLYNNTYLFYRAGASGVLIEANPDFADPLRSNRPRDVLLSCGCTAGSQKGVMTYYKTNRAGYNTFVKSIAEKYGTAPEGTGGVYVTETLSVPIYPINMILAENFPEKHVDYISVDIEGMGCEVVSDIDFDQYQIDVILLEMNPDSLESHQLYRKLAGLNYQMVYKGIGGRGDFLFYRKDVFGEPAIF